MCIRDSARTYHHLVPTKLYTLVRLVKRNQMAMDVEQIVEENIESIDLRLVEGKNCSGCNQSLINYKADAEEQEFITRCKECNHFFCLECDIFIHDNLHYCPECI
eukprot:TRINITY_DN8332_c0_g1_i2.p1 TRINITY_DN8332_c0_g1~~TRINITY_DN8332_c0_g1_i2.p1  ORF type:complete len:105 (-),score=17.67 TRINITY_DN8332_c0_g1_i2:107-421(-)